ncbi:MAG: hypothetical protein JNK75_13235 [Betaproteobacteria bacterium]|nr:hypothetical protein [Betaproteobacteria bacterium]
MELFSDGCHDRRMPGAGVFVLSATNRDSMRYRSAKRVPAQAVGSRGALRRSLDGDVQWRPRRVGWTRNEDQKNEKRRKFRKRRELDAKKRGIFLKNQAHCAIFGSVS